jgi:hypothetical protein
MAARLCALIPDFAAVLAMPTDAATTRIERAAIGRPLGRPEWIAMRDRRFGPRLAPRKPGPKPRVGETPHGKRSCCETESKLSAYSHTVQGKRKSHQDEASQGEDLIPKRMSL